MSEDKHPFYYIIQLCRIFVKLELFDTHDNRTYDMAYLLAERIVKSKRITNQCATQPCF